MSLGLSANTLLLQKWSQVKIHTVCSLLPFPPHLCLSQLYRHRLQNAPLFCWRSYSEENPIWLLWRATNKTSQALHINPSLKGKLVLAQWACRGLEPITTHLSKGQLISGSDAISCQGKLKTKVNCCARLECGHARECRNMLGLIYVQKPLSLNQDTLL